MALISSVQAIAAVIVYAARKNKLEFVKAVTGQVDQFVNSLTAEEQAELEGDIKSMVEQKSEEFVTNLESEVGEEKADEVVKMLQKSAN